jgi:hypothetical protein
MCDKKGGNVLASGGFGCVFSPALTCKGENEQPSGLISKLMLEKYAIEEYSEINNIRAKLKDIPNYKNYFLLNNFSTCKPDKLKQSDLTNYTKKCTALKKSGINKKNINKNLDKLMILNMPNGGVPVDDFIQLKGSFQKLYDVNKLLIDLLQNGIIPMNNENIYHCDIKDSNTLIGESNKNKTKIRLIDWGLSTEYIPFKNNSFPTTWRNRPLQFNVPFSVIIFTDDFVKKYTEYIEKGGEITERELRPFVLDYIYFWLKERGYGHYKFINEIMYILFNRELPNIKDEDKYKIIENEFTVTYIVNYIIEVLLHYTKFRKDGTLNLREYLDNVFIHIVDIWGFVTIYVPFLITFNENYNDLSNSQLKIFELLKHIIIEYLYSPRIEPIKINNLVKDLNKLSELFLLEIHIKKYSKNKITRSNNSSKFTFDTSRTKSKSKTKKNKSYLMITNKN